MKKPNAARWRRLRELVYLRGDGCCHICGQFLYENWVVEHVVPLERGGTWDEDNLAAAHTICNSRKGTRLMEELPPLAERWAWQYSNAEAKEPDLRWVIKAFA